MAEIVSKLGRPRAPRLLSLQAAQGMYHSRAPSYAGNRVKQHVVGSRCRLALPIESDADSRPLFRLELPLPLFMRPLGIPTGRLAPVTEAPIRLLAAQLMIGDVAPSATTPQIGRLPAQF